MLEILCNFAAIFAEKVAEKVADKIARVNGPLDAPNLCGFISRLKQYQQIEYRIALKNNKIDVHLRKWGKILALLH